MLALPEYLLAIAPKTKPARRGEDNGRLLKEALTFVRDEFRRVRRTSRIVAWLDDGVAIKEIRWRC